MKKTPKIMALLLALVMALSLFAACGSTGGSTGGNDAAQSAAPSAQGGDAQEDWFEISVAAGSEPGTLDPNAEIGNNVISMNNHMWEGLYKRDANDELVFGQAKSVDVSDDGLTWTFTLRDDIYWTDGEPVTAQDFEYSWKRLTAGGYDYSYFLDCVVGATDVMEGADLDTMQCKALDDKTFQVQLVAPNANFEEICAYGVTVPVRQDIIEEYGDSWCLTPDHFISNGPYKLVTWANQDKIVMEQNEYYYDRDSLGPDRITWLLLEDDNAILTAFESGDVMYASSYPTEEYDRLKDSGVLQAYPQLGTYYIVVESGDNAVPELEDPLVRRALALVIDRSYIVDTIAKGGYTAADSYINPGFTYPDGSDYKDHGDAWWDNDTYEANCEEARSLLAEAGYPNGEGFPTISYMSNSSSMHDTIAEYVQNCWKTELGISATYDTQEWAVFIETRNAGDYELARGGWTVDYHDPLGLFQLFQTGNGNNDSHWSDADYDALLDEAAQTDDNNVRYDLFQQAEAILGEELPVIPILYYAETYLLDTSAYQGYYTEVDGTHFQYVTAK